MELQYAPALLEFGHGDPDPIGNRSSVDEAPIHRLIASASPDTTAKRADTVKCGPPRDRQLAVREQPGAYAFLRRRIIGTRPINPVPSSAIELGSGVVVKYAPSVCPSPSTDM